MKSDVFDTKDDMGIEFRSSFSAFFTSLPPSEDDCLPLFGRAIITHPKTVQYPSPISYYHSPSSNSSSSTREKAITMGSPTSSLPRSCKIKRTEAVLERMKDLTPYSRIRERGEPRFYVFSCETGASIGRRQHRLKKRRMEGQTVEIFLPK